MDNYWKPGDRDTSRPNHTSAQLAADARAHEERLLAIARKLDSGSYRTIFEDRQAASEIREAVETLREVRRELERRVG